MAQPPTESSEREGPPDPEDIDWGPPKRPLEKGDPCPVCEYPFDPDEWKETHYSRGAAIGESWGYTCPSCEKETASIGT